MNQIPKRYRKIVARARGGHSRKEAIHIYCLADCCNWQRELVRNCGNEDCSLFLYRPYSAQPSPEKRHVAVGTPGTGR